MAGAFRLFVSSSRIRVNPRDRGNQKKLKGNQEVAAPGAATFVLGVSLSFGAPRVNYPQRRTAGPKGRSRFPPWASPTTRLMRPQPRV